MAKTCRDSCYRHFATDCQRINNGGKSRSYCFLERYIQTEPVDKIIIGLPKQMNNELSESMKYITPFVHTLKKRITHIPIEYVDERFTSVLAHRTMLEAGLKKKIDKTKLWLDTISATIILQTYLESIKTNTL